MQAQIEFPKNQDWLTKRMLSIGLKYSDEGVCFGFAHMAAQKFLSGRFDEFIDKLRLINNIPEGQFKRWINLNKNNPSDTQSRLGPQIVFPQREKSWGTMSEVVAQILALFQGLELIQQPDLYPQLFESGKRPLGQYDLESVMKLLQPAPEKHSKSLEVAPEAHTFFNAASFTGIYNLNELKLFFENLKNLLFSEKTMLFLDSPSHEIAVGIHQGKWILIDANEAPFQSFDNEERLASAVMNSLLKNSDLSFSSIKNPIITFQTIIVGLF